MFSKKAFKALPKLFEIRILKSNRRLKSEQFRSNYYINNKQLVQIKQRRAEYLLWKIQGRKWKIQERFANLRVEISNSDWIEIQKKNR